MTLNLPRLRQALPPERFFSLAVRTNATRQEKVRTVGDVLQMLQERRIELDATRGVMLATAGTDVFECALLEWTPLDVRLYVHIVLEFLSVFKTASPNLFCNFSRVLLDNGDEQRLISLLQSHVIPDSPVYALFLVGEHNRFGALLQFALDMFKRMGNSNAEIFDVLVSAGDYLQALQFANDKGIELTQQDCARILDCINNPILHFQINQFLSCR